MVIHHPQRMLIQLGLVLIQKILLKKKNISGRGVRKEIKQNQVALYERGKNNVTLVTAQPAEILMLGGKPHNEPTTKPTI